MEELDLRARIREIMTSATMTDAEKSQARQQLFMGVTFAQTSSTEIVPHTEKTEKNPKSDALTCVICLSMCERPVTAPCQHNFCLACFNRWTSRGNYNCPTCRAPHSKKFATNPRVNTMLVTAIRYAKMNTTASKKKDPKPFVRMDNDSRPEKAFLTERARRNGRANAKSGRILVTIPNDWFGPIPSEHDPENHRGVCVGDWWADRMDCRQYGAHFPHVAGIAGQAQRGAQSVVLSGGYEDDLDNGDWFIYTGSGGRDLSGNKRTNKNQSFDQEFKAYNEALRVSCIRGLPIRVVRSHKEKRSPYAPPPEMPIRYDGIYRILRCWRKPGKQKFLICRYLFIRCDNAPAPWSSTETSDEPNLEIPSEAAKEIREASGKVYQMSSDPYWDYDKKTKRWLFLHEQPPHAASGHRQTSKAPIRKKASTWKRAVKKFTCRMCSEILKSPVSTPCGHSFCMKCLDAKFGSMDDIIDRTEVTGRTLRVRKVIKPCPVCQADISDFLKTATINRELEELIKQVNLFQKNEDESANESEDDAPHSSDDASDEEKEPELQIKETQPRSQDGLALTLESLFHQYSEFDKELIKGLMEDQGNDSEEVACYLEKMRRMAIKDAQPNKSNSKRLRTDTSDRSTDSKKQKDASSSSS